MAKNFVGTFQAEVAKIESDAKKVGLNMTSVCRELGVSRATPDRWKREIPMTVQLVARMQGVVAAEAKAKGIALD